MNKIYPEHFVDQRIREVGVEDDGDGANSPGYKDCYTDPRYRNASWIGCGLAIF